MPTMLTDLIVASLDDAPAILTAQGHANIWPTLESRGLSPALLASLRRVMRGEAATLAQAQADVEQFEVLSQGGECEKGDPWLAALPPDLVQHLALMAEAQCEPVAAAWALTDVARHDRWQAAELTPLLAEMSALAAGAVAQGKGMLLWMCP
jgi:NADH pyrophosphatase NudC (nudix superfamily)